MPSTAAAAAYSHLSKRKKMVLRANGYRAFCSGLFAGFGVLFAWQSAHRVVFAPYLFVMCLILVIRALRLAVVVTADEIVIRSWVRRRRVATADVIGVVAVPYSGMWARGGSLFWLEELQLLQRDASEVLVPSIIGLRRGPHGTVQTIVARLNNGLAQWGPPDDVA
jgi:hypothetical protein